MDALPNWHYLTKHFKSQNCSNIKHLEAVNIACSITYANNFKMTE